MSKHFSSKNKIITSDTTLGRCQQARLVRDSQQYKDRGCRPPCESVHQDNEQLLVLTSPHEVARKFGPDMHDTVVEQSAEIQVALLRVCLLEANMVIGINEET